MIKLKESIFLQANIVLDRIHETQKLVIEREQERLAYDHYRKKVTDMERPGHESTS